MKSKSYISMLTFDISITCSSRNVTTIKLRPLLNKVIRSLRPFPGRLDIRSTTSGLGVREGVLVFSPGSFHFRLRSTFNPTPVLFYISSFYLTIQSIFHLNKSTVPKPWIKPHTLTSGPNALSLCYAPHTPTPFRYIMTWYYHVSSSSTAGL